MNIDKEEEFSDDNITILLALIDDSISDERRRVEVFSDVKGLPDLESMAKEMGREHDAEFQMLKFVPKQMVDKVIAEFCADFVVKVRARLVELAAIKIKLHLLKSRI